MDSGAKLLGTIDAGPQQTVHPDDPFQVWRAIQESSGTTRDEIIGTGVGSAAAPPLPTSSDLRALAELDDPRLVLSEAYVGIDRRRTGVARALARIAYFRRRSLLRLDVLIVLALAVLAIGAGLLITTLPQGAPRAGTGVAATPTDPPIALPRSGPAASTVPTTAPSIVPSATPSVAPVAAAVAPVAPVAVVAPTAPSAPATPATPTTSALPVADPSSPSSMGAAALALVRYPWQQLPGYSIKFASIADAPSAGFYGNTNFTWGKAGGVSTLYVYPGETVDQLAGITAFEIGHEVDAAYVEPQGGHDQIAAILGIHPASWAPQCDCAEQGYLSGWYASAFSAYWSPGVGAWSSLAPPPSGAVLAAVQPWLNPRVS
jgi:hypothetical protein